MRANLLQLRMWKNLWTHALEYTNSFIAHLQKVQRTEWHMEMVS